MRVAVFLVLMISPHMISSAQTIWYVPDDFSTIQAAISDAAVIDGDTIIVRDGVYSGFSFNEKSLTLKGENGAKSTILDGGKVGPVISLDKSCQSYLPRIIDGFTIRNGAGYNTGLDYRGGGIYGKYAGPAGTIISNNIITSNDVKGACLNLNRGGGIYCEQGYFSIINNVIRDNIVKTPTNWATNGGGIFCMGYGSEIVNNIIVNNHAGGGGGICISANIAINNINIPVTIKNNIICNNVAGASAYIDGFGGGILLFDGAWAVVVNNLISNNWANGYGGGLCYLMNCGSLLSYCPCINNVIYKNGAIVQGGGLMVTNNSYLHVVNSIIWNNSASSGAEIRIGNNALPSSYLTINHSDVMGGMSHVFCDSYSTLDWGSGMIDEDPQFIDPDGADNTISTWLDNDFHISFASPCRETGDNSVVTELHDFEGDPRIADGTVDMGADEFHPHLYLTGETTPTGNVEIKFIGYPGNDINGLILGINIFDPPLPCDYGLWYMNNPFQIMTVFGTIPVDGVKIFPGTIPTFPPAPYTVYLQGVIDMWLTNLCTVNVQ